ncbi:MAG: tetratricopeptide repeat protein [Planctomycetota bacterium]
MPPRQPPPDSDPTVPRGAARRRIAGDSDDLASTRPQSRVVADTRAGLPAAPRAAASGMNRFRLGDELGRGGMGTVRLAEDPQLRRELAIKLLHDADPASSEQFIEEAQITSQLQHPNIVPIYEFGSDSDGRPWLAMKRIEGDSLADRIAAWKRSDGGRAIPPGRMATILTMFSKACDAVAFAHSRGVIHRDIKPHNIMVGAYGELLLVDWGLAKPLAGNADTMAEQPARPIRTARRETGDAATLDGDVFGTPAYMPPEQAEGRIGDVDEQSDIFALGGVLYHMLTLSAPYAGRGASETLALAAQHRLIAPRRRAPAAGIPRELQAIVLKAMAADKADRYATVDAMQADLAAWQAHLPTTAWRAGPIERLAKWTRRHPTLSLASLLIMLAGLAVAVLVGQLQASESARRLAEADKRTAELESNLAIEKQRAAEQAAHAAQLKTESTVETMMALLDEGSRDRIERFRKALTGARARGTRDEEFGRRLGKDARDYMIAYDQLFELCHQNRVEPTPAQLFERALIRKTTGDLSGAIEDYDAALRQRTDLHELWVGRGAARLKLGEAESALRDLDRALQLAPESVSALIGRGNALKALGRLDEALEMYTAAIAASDQDTTTWHSRGNFYGDTGQWELSIRDYTKALEFKDALPDSWACRGQSRLMIGQVDEAMADFAQAVKVDPDYAQTYVYRSTALCSLGRLDEALADCNTALRINPELDIALWNRSNIHKFNGDLDAALADINEAIRLKPTAGAFCNRGEIHARANRIPEALADYAAAIEADARCDGAYINRAIIRVRQKRFDDAVADLDQAIRINPGQSAAYVTRGNIRFQRNDYDGAIADYNKATSLDPRNWQALVNGGLVLMRMQRNEEAIGMLQRAYRACNEAGARPRIAGYLRRLNAEVPRDE